MRSAIIALSLLGLAACGSGGGDSKTTETRMDDIDSLEGTISDDPIATDAASDEAPIEAAPQAASPTGKGPAPRLDKDQAEESGGPDVVQIEPVKEDE
jgi:hypothetical protein